MKPFTSLRLSLVGLASFVVFSAACTAAQDLGDRPAEGDPMGQSDAGNNDASTPPSGKDSGAPPGAKDTTAPTVVLAASPSKVTAAGNITLTVTASDASPITNVVIYAGAAALTTLQTPPYSVTRPVAQADNGTYVFTAEATDAAGNVGRSAPVTVTVEIAGPPLPNIPTFVAAGAATLVTGGTSLALATPAGVQAGDFLIAMVDAQEELGSATLPTPAGWSLVPGFPVHNLANAHPPYVIPASENHGTWILHKFADAAEPVTSAFDLSAAATARGVMVSYRGVDPVAPVHDKSALAFYGTGGTNGLGSGNTSLQRGRQVNLIATAVTAHATYTVVQSSSSITERFNSGEQPTGLNLIVHDSTSSFGIFTGPSIANKQSPSGSPDGFLFSATTLVLKPQ